MITKDTTLAEILNHKGAKKILEKYELPCLACPMAGHEMGVLKVGDVAKQYGVDLRGLLRELNEKIGKS